jgi:hypothetical protein
MQRGHALGLFAVSFRLFHRTLHQRSAGFQAAAAAVVDEGSCPKQDVAVGKEGGGGQGRIELDLFDGCDVRWEQQVFSGSVSVLATSVDPIVLLDVGEVVMVVVVVGWWRCR